MPKPGLRNLAQGDWKCASSAMIRSRSSMTSVANRLKTGSSASAEVGRSDGAGGIAGEVLPELGRDWLVSKRLTRDRSSVFSDSKRDTLTSS
jgi:hypothetical protein